jgi:hypothetical protein
MISSLKRLIVVSLLAIAGCEARGSSPPATTQSGPANEGIYDGFESDELSGVWDRRKFEPGAVVIQSEVVRAGRCAAKITIRQGDRFDPARADGSSIDNERDELLERRDLYAREGDAYAYSFSIFIPRDFPIVPTRLVMAQLKHYDRGGAKVDNPIIALRYTDGEMRITLQTAYERTTMWRTREDVRGRWLDFVWHVRFARTGDGYFHAWFDGNQIVDYTGVTAYREEHGYPPGGEFKMGLYRDTMPEPMSAYFDEYRKRPLP